MRAAVEKVLFVVVVLTCAGIAALGVHAVAVPEVQQCPTCLCTCDGNEAVLTIEPAP